MTTTTLTLADAEAIAAERQRQFDAVRPPCPPWCAGACTGEDHFGDSVMHGQPPAEVPSVPDKVHAPPGIVTVKAWRFDALGDGSDCGIELDVRRSGNLVDDQATLTPGQARRLAAELLNSADLLDPAPTHEVDVPVAQVRVGDLLPLAGSWLYVYCVDVDEPSNTVQVYVTVDPKTFPELDGDEEPHRFEQTDWVRVRRPGHPTASIGETVMLASGLRLGDEVLTPNGWERIAFLIFDGIGQWVQVYGSEEALDESRSWDLRPAAPVRVRTHSAVCAVDHTAPRRIDQAAA